MKKQATRHHWSSLIAFLGWIPASVCVLILASFLQINLQSIIIALLVASVAICWWLSINLWLFLFAPQFIKAIRPTGRCVRCLYDMSRCPIEDDDCRICPECGSAWKIKLAQPRLSL